jgi:DNA-directed RNA polymerase subunit M/transcription elongation factor TFIIS
MHVPHQSVSPFEKVRTNCDKIVHTLAAAVASNTRSRRGRPSLSSVMKTQNEVQLREMGYRITIGFLIILHGHMLWECLWIDSWTHGFPLWTDDTKISAVPPARSPRFVRTKAQRGKTKDCESSGLGRSCHKCQSREIFFGTTDPDDEQRWRLFVCKKCYENYDLKFSSDTYHRILR